MADNSAIPIVTHRPKDDAFHQQRLKTWQPILSPMNVIIIFTVIGVIFVGMGVGMMDISNNVKEYTFVYDSAALSHVPGCTDIISCGCQVTAEYPSGHICPGVEFTISEDIEGPLYVYYGLDNFYQNHRLYVKSQNVAQLLGQTVAPTSLESDCGKKYKSSDGKILYPCGLIANSYFNDRFQLVSGGVMDETGIAWPSDFNKFKNPEGFQVKPYTGQPCNDPQYGFKTGGSGDPMSYLNPSTGLQYCYWYPNMATFNYLWIDPNNPASPSYSVIKQNYLDPTKGIQDEHLMVWMRTAALPNFRKLYGKVKGPFKKGAVLKFNINSNFEVQSFGGSKTLILSTISSLGGKNSYLGISYLVIGCLSLLLTALFVIKNCTTERRKLGDTNLLRWED